MPLVGRSSRRTDTHTSRSVMVVAVLMTWTVVGNRADNGTDRPQGRHHGLVTGRYLMREAL